MTKPNNEFRISLLEIYLPHHHASKFQSTAWILNFLHIHWVEYLIVVDQFDKFNTCLNLSTIKNSTDFKIKLLLACWTSKIVAGRWMISALIWAIQEWIPYPISWFDNFCLFLQVFIVNLTWAIDLLHLLVLPSIPSIV